MRGRSYWTPLPFGLVLELWLEVLFLDRAVRQPDTPDTVHLRVHGTWGNREHTLTYELVQLNPEVLEFAVKSMAHDLIEESMRPVHGVISTLQEALGNVREEWR